MAEEGRVAVAWVDAEAAGTRAAAEGRKRLKQVGEQSKERAEEGHACIALGPRQIKCCHHESASAGNAAPAMQPAKGLPRTGTMLKRPKMVPLALSIWMRSGWLANGTVESWPIFNSCEFVAGSHASWPTQGATLSAEDAGHG